MGSKETVEISSRAKTLVFNGAFCGFAAVSSIFGVGVITILIGCLWGVALGIYVHASAKNGQPLSNAQCNYWLLIHLLGASAVLTVKSLCHGDLISAALWIVLGGSAFFINSMAESIS